MPSPKFTALIAALQSISPMPDDDTLNNLPDENDPLEKLHNILGSLKQETQSEYPLDLIPPLLETFGTGTGNGVYWSLLSLVEKYPNKQELYPLIQQATHSANAGTRKWCCYLLGRRRSREDEAFFTELLHDSSAEVRIEALGGILMLSQLYRMGHLIPSIEPLLQDNDYEVYDMAKKVLDALRTSTE